ncbi:transcriptional regulator, LysR family [Novosphingobium nitrogenifigens DSM 19370]|uniref:Transcriptional regulator, LysR family n=1 Tax=Novosphingobium nitrogenifigens DSM 19370 TaxID=983920 RepID=F1ZAT9_9SPHN|nr:LysR family transcriptional regulator [Novosphingobium nitrogenifigens]EGD58283.1 transcriptional regulator, LysR family [Novosphingobium nitrogenifigens DSM 19370]
MQRLPSEFDLHALEVFVVTVELGGMTASATQLRITQSAVSQTITRLEGGIGTPLFDRSLRPLGLTPAGRALYERARKLLTSARTVIDEVREGANLPVDQITIAMSETFATLLTAPLLGRFGMRVGRWRIRSGISLVQQQDFLARRVDMLVTGSNTLEKHPGIEHHDVMDDPFVLIFPRDYTGSTDPVEAAGRLPFVRYALDHGMGQRIESQLTRMKLRLPNVIEVDIIHQQLTTVALGIGWSITSALCLVAMPSLVEHLRIEPLPRGRFSRRVQVVGRAAELGNLAEQTAQMAREVMLTDNMGQLIQQFPWLADQIK